MKKEKRQGWALFIFFLILLIADLIIPDPLPLLDEIVLGLFTLWSGKQII